MADAEDLIVLDAAEALASLDRISAALRILREAHEGKSDGGADGSA